MMKFKLLYDLFLLRQSLRELEKNEIIKKKYVYKEMIEQCKGRAKYLIKEIAREKNNN